ncbi:mediator complex subunit rgr-1 [Culex quinquefasciatus]|uniref:Mediator complex subunit rgr-1 n=1 Tax=Culex quinquefasciatus TaxID=7176 RepID=B0X598_CULQU|nr:mediator complex subunit rgr-1 [Culex quinquefasciatus]|eukprot:XP_001864820.1 mediator complex subunit rgr-1 [Culex quinquefasciatus]
MPYMGGQSHTDGSPFTVSHSPAASNWPGSPGMPRPSSRPCQNPDHKAKSEYFLLLHTTKLPAFWQLQLQANYIHQLIHGRIVDSPDALAEVYNCLHYFSRDATCKLNSTLQLLCDKVLEMHVTALLDAAPKFLRNRLKDVLQGTLIEVEPGVLLMFHDPDKA